jgi:manganese transport protein
VLLSFLTLAAELGGVGLVLNLFFDVSDQAFILVGLLALIAAKRLLRFGAIERIFGYSGLVLLVYVAGAVQLHPGWHALDNGFVPEAQSSALYACVVVGLIAVAMIPYEIYFCSSGGIEEGWTEEDLGVNRGTPSSATGSERYWWPES